MLEVDFVQLCVILLPPSWEIKCDGKITRNGYYLSGALRTLVPPVQSHSISLVVLGLRLGLSLTNKRSSSWSES